MKPVRKLLLAGMAIAMMASPALAQSYRFAVVPKAMNNPFFDVARDGCLKRAKELGNVQCIYKDRSSTNPRPRRRSSRTSSRRRWTAWPISVADVAAMTKSIDAAVAAGIPVVTFDADAPGSKRIAYIGHQQQDFGLALGKQLLQLRPDGGNTPSSPAAPAPRICRTRRWCPRSSQGIEVGRGLRLAGLQQR